MTSLMQLGEKRASKFNAQQVVIDGQRFHSKAEANWYAGLKLRERAGEIHHLQRQVPFPLYAGKEPVILRGKSGKRTHVKYIADAVYVENGVKKIADFKGFDENYGRLKRAFVEAQYGVVIDLVRAVRK